MNWRAVSQVEMLVAVTSNDPDSLTLAFESGLDSLVLFSLQGGSNDLTDRCRIDQLSSDFVTAFQDLSTETIDENERILEHRKSELDGVSKKLITHAKAVWTYLPEEVKKIIQETKRLYVILSPFGSIDEFPIELILTENGWLGCTHEICRANSITELVISLSSDQPARQVKKTGLIISAGTPTGMNELEFATKEAKDVTHYVKLLGMETECQTTLNPKGLLEALDTGHHLFHYIGHGTANNLGERLLLSESERLPASWLRQLKRSRTPIAFLSACEVGRTRIADGRDKGFVVEMLSAGSPAVVAATRRISDRVNGELVREIYAASFAEDISLPEALRTSRTALNGANDNTGSGLNPVCWSSFAFYGNPITALKPSSVQPSLPAWHQLAMRYLASGSDDYREEAIILLNGISSKSSVFKEMIELLTEKSNWRHIADSLLTKLAHEDFLAALRIRVYLSVKRVEAERTRKKPDKKLILDEIGTGLTIALTLDDAFALVGTARQHCKLVGIVVMDEVLQVLRHAKNLAEDMAIENENFSSVAKELSKELAQYDGKIMMDLTKVIPEHLID